ncbi:tRNA pseudouridine(13) synthase TruD [Halorhabdus sp. CBA1104]|uniref:tRNA pseudouridine(13) synthase TruD n=1 Tax=Halorhabdus sp. CBA1104 TaxID=1380432 RepID=UPI0012B32B67|nr:tRNA pseudouridine(13) synthase TruD [Halorhabdus sp. CBA1104]QGN06182.1 tRNA pseudouridine(13) synthase TruD [Halorhabdus sp. CBA1104]
MRQAHPLEQAVGMAYYVSDSDGVGGHLRREPAAFAVREIEAFDVESIDAERGAYPHVVFRATLSGWDTNDFANVLSDQLSISRERVSWAGTKDKHARTTQLFSATKVDPGALDGIDLSEVEIEVLGRSGRPILFGDLAGNAFEIVVSEPDSPDRIEAVVDELATFAGSGFDGEGDATTVGVPNFFGQQRFGSERPVTHEVGLAIARGDWKAAVLAYVGNPHEREREETREARAYVTETEDWAGALDRLPNRLGYERSMCHRLAENGANEPDDFRDALEAVPTNLQQLFVNAAQSYAFNRILSARLERGLPFDEPVAGDVVCFADSDAPDGLELPDTDRIQRVTEDNVGTVRRHCERGRAFVTAPLLGSESELADGEPGEIERAVFDELGISPADFDLPGEFHSEGTRRAMLLRTALAVERDPLTLSFALPKGSYATVVLREITKADPAAL